MDWLSGPLASILTYILIMSINHPSFAAGVSLRGQAQGSTLGDLLSPSHLAYHMSHLHNPHETNVLNFQYTLFHT